MSNNTSDRTNQILALLFPLHATITCDGALETKEENPCAWYKTFVYTNQQNKTSNWTINLHEAVYFEFRTTYYMVIRGDRGGPVCFKLNGCRTVDNLTLVADVEGAFDFLQADPDCFPTEDTQDWMLKQINS